MSKMTKHTLNVYLECIANLQQQKEQLVNEVLESFRKDGLFPSNENVEKISSGQYKNFDELSKDFTRIFGQSLSVLPDGEERTPTQISINPKMPEDIEVSITDHDGGTLTAYTSTCDYGTSQAGIVHYDKERFSTDIAMAEIVRGDLAKVKGRPEDNLDIDVMVYGNPEIEDYTKKYLISKEDIDRKNKELNEDFDEDFER